MDVKKQIRSAVLQIAAKKGREPDADVHFEQLSPDGSTRQFFRVKKNNETLCLAVLPAGDEQRDIDEQHSVYNIGSHLHERSIPVPEVYFSDGEKGLVLMEDLGDQRLYDAIFSCSSEDEKNDRINLLYKKVIKQLARMQFEGAKGLDPDWCYDSARYDQDIMIRTEAQYFETAFYTNYLGRTSEGAMYDEFVEIAQGAESGFNNCFLHRDFQSRNIMVRNNNVFFIDFQGGRLGPPGYDLASLLLDPYIGLAEEVKQELFDYYLEQADTYEEFDKEEFQQVYPYLAIQRNLQIIGAFSFLFQVKKKPFFKDYIQPSVQSLHTILQQNEFSSCFHLRNAAEESLFLVEKQPK